MQVNVIHYRAFMMYECRMVTAGSPRTSAIPKHPLIAKDVIKLVSALIWFSGKRCYKENMLNSRAKMCNIVRTVKVTSYLAYL
jgi:hypothetical protein